MTNNFELDTVVENNFRNVKLWFLIPPLLVLFSFFLYFSLSAGTNFSDEYVASQKALFYFLNSNLSEYPNLQFNLTQLGDALIFYPLVIIFLFYAPKLWQALLTSSIITLIVSAVLKRFFAVPRPAAMFDNESFTIMGKTLIGHTSLPSGHSMTALIVITILLYAFMPKKIIYKTAWILLFFIVGFFIVFSRVGVGAHYPFDVIIGSAIGYLAAIIGIKVNNNVAWLEWIKNKRVYPFFMVILLIWVFLIVKKIVALNLPIFYLSLLSLVITFFIITNAYVKRN